jgi:TonB family protein
LVDKNGKVLKSEIYKSSGFIWLDDAAKEATSNNKYKPAIYKEKPVLYWVTHKVDFVLE